MRLYADNCVKSRCFGGELVAGPILPPYYLNAHPRVLCGLADIGVYEFGIGDFDCNRTVNLSDFAWFPYCLTGPNLGAASLSGSPRQIADFQFPIANWRNAPPRITRQSAIGNWQSVGCEAFDFNADLAIDLCDLAGFQRTLTGP